MTSNHKLCFKFKIINIKYTPKHVIKKLSEHTNSNIFFPLLALSLQHRFYDGVPAVDRPH